MCRVLHLSESGYYRWLRNRGRHSSRQLLAGKVKKILEEHPDNRNYGVNRVCLALEQDGVDVSRRTVYRVMKENGWLHKRSTRSRRTSCRENRSKRSFSAMFLPTTTALGSIRATRWDCRLRSTGSGRRRKRQLDPMPPQFSCVPLRSTSENCAVLPCFSDFGYFPTAHFLTFPIFERLRNPFY